jgi:rubredoxin
MIMYKVARQGKIIGEHKAGAIQRMIDAGSLMVSDHAWTAGMAEWKQLADLGYHPPEKVNLPPQPQSPGSLVRPEASAKVRRVPDEPRCPGCGSKSVQAASMAYAVGTRDSESVGISSRGRVYYRVGRSASRLANALAPPSPDGPNPIFGILMFASFILGARGCAAASPLFNGTGNTDSGGWVTMFFGVVMFFVFMYFRQQSSSESESEFNEQMEDYSQKWFCKKCGATFTR